VVEAGSAEMLHDSTEVELEEDASGVNGDRDWAFSDGGSEGVRVVDGNILVGFDLNASTLSGASAIGTLVWVLSLGLDGSGLSVLEGRVHKTTVATGVLVVVGAVDELLLGEGDKGLVLDEPSSLHGSGSGEGPA